MPRTSAYSTLKSPVSSFASYDWRRSARPTICSQSSCVPKARTPRTCVTVRASQPSLSIETETTQRVCSPSRSSTPTVFTTSRRRSSSVSPSACRRSPVRWMISRRKRSISSAAAVRNWRSSASPESSCSLSISSVRRAGERLTVLVEVAEQPHAALLEARRAVVVRTVEAGDVVVDQLRCGGVVADDDKAWGHADFRGLPFFEGLLVVAVEGVEGRQELRGQPQGICRGLAPALLRHGLPDVLPEFPEHRHFALGDVVGHRYSRQLDDPAFDGIHQREVARSPGEQRSLLVPGTRQEEGRC